MASSLVIPVAVQNLELQCSFWPNKTENII